MSPIPNSLTTDFVTLDDLGRRVIIFANGAATDRGTIVDVSVGDERFRVASDVSRGDESEWPLTQPHRFLSDVPTTAPEPLPGLALPYANDEDLIRLCRVLATDHVRWCVRVLAFNRMSPTIREACRRDLRAALGMGQSADAVSDFAGALAVSDPKIHYAADDDHTLCGIGVRARAMTSRTENVTCRRCRRRLDPRPDTRPLKPLDEHDATAIHYRADGGTLTCGLSMPGRYNTGYLGDVTCPECRRRLGLAPL